MTGQLAHTAIQCSSLTGKECECKSTEGTGGIGNRGYCKLFDGYVTTKWSASERKDAEF